jgi:hypothetical protein
MTHNSSFSLEYASVASAAILSYQHLADFSRCLWYAVNEKLAVFQYYLTSSITFGNQEGQHIRLIRNKKKVKKKQVLIG